MYYATMQILVRGEADIPEDRLRYAEVMYDVFYLNKKKKKKKKCMQVFAFMFEFVYCLWKQVKLN